MIGYLVSILGGGGAGSIVTNIISNYRNRLQKMYCYFIDDDILSKIPQANEENEVRQNLYCKHYLIQNTTNKDLKEFKLIFQFDPDSVVTECFSQSKEGYDKHKIRVGKTDKNFAISTIRNFNRGDKVEYTFKVANVTDNKYYVTESDCIGFKIVCKDKRKDFKKTRSAQSSQVLVKKH